MAELHEKQWTCCWLSPRNAVHLTGPVSDHISLVSKGITTPLVLRAPGAQVPCEQTTLLIIDFSGAPGNCSCCCAAEKRCDLLGNQTGVASTNSSNHKYSG